MECKYQHHVQKRGHSHELIETLWNVNELPTLGEIVGRLELIETLWNVNDGITEALDTGQGN